MLVEVLFYVFATILVAAALGRDHFAEPGACGAVPGLELLRRARRSGC